MMKNKKVTILFLVVAVILIWGVILFKIFNKAQLPVSKMTGSIADKIEKKEELKEYTLLLDYPDPFFSGKRIVKKRSTVNKSTVKKKKKGKRWPVIKFNGYLSSEDAQRGHFSFKGSSLILTKGDSIAPDICLEELFKDSVLISFHHEKKWYFR